MKRFIFAVAVVMACLFSVGGALADSYTAHVTTAPNGKGDLVVYPVYMASEGLETKITVINTSLTHSVVAKLIVRSQVYSQEVLDFMLYLSPTDMWIGTLKHGANGPVMVSTDLSGPTFPSAGQPLAVANCSGDTNEYGYVEIIEAWSGTLGAPPVAKDLIRTTYEAFPIPYDVAQTVNTLAGSYMISVPAVGWEASDNAVVFKDYDNLTRLSVGLYTLLGQDSFNLIHEVDAAFNKKNIAMTFNSSSESGGTLHMFTFPTKQSYIAGNCTYAARFSPYFPDNGTVRYHMRVQDNEEHTTQDPDDPFSPTDDPEILSMRFELNIKDVLKDSIKNIPFFDFGWMLYHTFLDDKVTSSTNRSGQVLAYDGVPVIPVIVDFNNGLSLRTAAWTDGTVTDGVNPIPGYQYTAGLAVTK